MQDSKVISLAWKRLQSSSKYRKLGFSLSQEKFEELVLQECLYCGKPPNEISGLDRIHSNAGYHPDNLVPCCTKCNMMKRDSFVCDFSQACRNVMIHQSGIEQVPNYIFQKVYFASSYLQYKQRAEKLGIPFQLSPEKYMNFIHAHCFYCNKPSPVGIDRIDNSQGYLENNIVPCCACCNYMKKQNTADDFIQHCYLITARTEWTYETLSNILLPPPTIYKQ